MSQPRKPFAFPVDPPQAPAGEPERPHGVRKPLAVPAEEFAVVASPVDVFETEANLDAEAPPPALPRRRRTRLWPIVAGALGVLASLAVGIWTDRLIEDLFQRAPWLGWVAVAAAAVGVLALTVIVLREALALARLGSIVQLRKAAAEVVARNDATAARTLVRRLAGLMETRAETAAGRRALAAHEDEVVDGADLVRIAEVDLFAPLDLQARRLVLDAAKRVSVVTAVSPRALVDLAYVAFESARLIRRIAELYGGRPGTLGFFRLSRAVLGHLAVTGAIAAGDDLVHQLVGQGLAARLSAKLGEGVVNGMMTARIGLAAMDVARPLPFDALPRPKLGDFLPLLARFATQKKAEG